jgi:formylglycine-generating enzyme required for sulfatase activity
MRVAGLASLGCVAAMGGGTSACSGSMAAPRAQLVVVVDTDAHVVGELASRPEVSPDAAVDTLRIDVLDDQNRLVDLHTFVVADTASWPLSFGIEPSPKLGSEVRIWVRAFRALFATGGFAENGAATLDPPSQVTIDRLIVLPLPTYGVQQVRVTLRGDCLGTPSGFGSPLQTCLGEGQLAGDPHQVDATGGATSSAVGTWGPALEVTCKSVPSSEQVCVPGGFFVLGDLNAVGDGDTPDAETVPLRPVVVSPFLIDKYEFTVGRFRTLVNQGNFSGVMPTARAAADPFFQFCTWLGANDASNDPLPLNCVPYASAVELCSGLLPTEAQWEYAARGRGQRLSYPWGGTEPQCCSASLNREGPPPVLPVMCPSTGVEPVGSHPLSAACTGSGPSGSTQSMGDVTRDGIYDMAGSLSEELADDLQSLSAPCWNTSVILRDPSCRAVNAAPVLRGSYWNAGFATALLPLRHSVSTDGVPTEGFRCAYKDGTP